MPIEHSQLGREIFMYTYAGAFTDAEYEVALSAMKQALESAASEGRRIAFLSVGTADSGMTSKQRSRTVGWLEENTPLLRVALVCQGVVVPGAMQRGVLTAILWMISYPVPIKTVANVAEGEQWARSMLAQDASSVRRAS